MSIRDRQGNYAFVKDRSYLAQLNEWAARPIIKFEVTRNGGEDHMPLFRATPICELYFAICAFPRRTKRSRMSR
ncbi:hypothetical protein K474DRAFT_1657061 [Panus rudis PR-1116 ss-1]|nr:hypothetical protein K474DRAFT_1657061 [Panus rudis PR-1116 ss-1]